MSDLICCKFCAQVVPYLCVLTTVLTTIHLFYLFLPPARNLLYHLPVHLCSRNQLWAVTVSSILVWPSWGHQSRLRLVHVLCLGWFGSYVTGWLPVHTRTIPKQPLNPYYRPQTQAWEWHCVRNLPTNFNRTLVLSSSYTLCLLKSTTIQFNTSHQWQDMSAGGGWIIIFISCMAASDE